MSLKDFKQVMREQFFMLLIDERAALEAIPSMLEKDPEGAADMDKKLHRILDVVGLQAPTAKSRLKEMETLFITVSAAKGAVADKADRSNGEPAKAHPTSARSGHASRRQH
jgi:hypothetical protein